MTRPQPDETDHQRIVELLRSLGATDSEIEATPLDQRSALALDVVLRDGRPPVSLSDAAEAIGRPAEDLARLWRALGFASNNADALIPASLVDAQQILATSGTELLGREATLGLARVIGASTARLAEALVDSFRVSFELPELGRGTRYSDVVKDYVDITRVALPSFESMVIAAFRAHLVRVAGSAWMPDLHEAAARRTIAIGFADLVGYTALSRTLTAAELAQMLRRFEDGVNDVLAEHGGRLIKQIGDGVMFTAETADAGAAIALALAAAFSRTDDTPPVRVSLAWGVVLTHLGDYYGDVVNLAARLVALAKPGTVVISDDALAAMSDQWRTERLPDQALKGFGTPAAVHRLVGR